MHPRRRLIRPIVVLASALLTGMFLGCGNSPAPAPKYIDVTGNWQFTLKITAPTPPALPSNPILVLSGSLSSSGSAVSGTLRAQSLSISPCVGRTANLAFTGTLDTAANLTLTAPISGGVATLSLNVGPSLLPIRSGTYQVVGGPCAQTSIAIFAYQVPNITATFTGTLTEVLPPPTGTAPTVDVTAALVQAATPNSDGQYPLSGTVAFTGACTSTLAFSQGVIYGSELQSYPSDQLLPPTSASFQGVASPGGVGLPQTIQAFLTRPPDCGITFFNGSLTRQ